MTDSKLPTTAPESSDLNQMAEAHANHLMDELFDSVERALDGDISVLEAASESQSAREGTSATDQPKLTLNFSEGGLPAILISEPPADESYPVPNLLGATQSTTDLMLTTPQPAWRRCWRSNRALLGAAGLALVATLGLWLYQRQQALVAVNSTTTVPAGAPAISDHAEFLEYLRRSLNVINQNASESAAATADAAHSGVPEVAIPPSSDGGVALPPLASNPLPPPVPPAAGDGSINVIERIYVPYPAAQPPGAPPAVATANPIDSPAAPTTAAAAPTAAPTHTLLGVLELGDRSAALFEIEGIPQRVYIGEGIGTSGWSLVSVGNEEAMMRRNGEVRSVYIGQQF